MMFLAACCNTKPNLHAPQINITDKIASHTTVVLLDFDGYVSRDSSIWEMGTFAPADYSDDEQLRVLNRVDDYYEEFDVYFTRDEILYTLTEPEKRYRAVISKTPLMIWEGFWARSMVGIAIYNQKLHKDTTAAYINAELWKTVGSTDDVSKVIAHEVAHMFGLAHQSTWDGVHLKAVYDPGDSLVAPLMGIPGVGKTAIWTIGVNEHGDLQDDRARLLRILGLRPKPIFPDPFKKP